MQLITEIDLIIENYNHKQKPAITKLYQAFLTFTIIDVDVRSLTLENYIDKILIQKSVE